MTQQILSRLPLLLLWLFIDEALYFTKVLIIKESPTLYVYVYTSIHLCLYVMSCRMLRILISQRINTFVKQRASSINSHGKSSGSLYRICCTIVPDPFFPAPHKRKKEVWLRETTNARTIYDVKIPISIKESYFLSIHVVWLYWETDSDLKMHLTIGGVNLQPCMDCQLVLTTMVCNCKVKESYIAHSTV